MMRTELKTLAAYNEVVLSILGRTKNQDIVYSILNIPKRLSMFSRNNVVSRVSSLKASKVHGVASAKQPEFFIQEDRSSGTLVIRCLSSEEVVAMACGFHTKTIAVFQVNSTLSFTLIGRIEINGAFAQVRDANFDYVLNTRMDTTTSHLCCMTPIKNFKVTNARDKTVTTICCRNNSMSFKNPGKLSYLIFLLTTCLVINRKGDFRLIKNRHYNKMSILGSNYFHQPKDTHIKTNIAVGSNSSEHGTVAPKSNQNKQKRIKT